MDIPYSVEDEDADVRDLDKQNEFLYAWANLR